MTNYHRHHIIPKHAGGSNSSENIELLTIAEHAEAHKLLYGLHGRWQDLVAWLGLSARIGKEQIEELARIAGYEEYKNDPARVKARALKCSESLRNRYKTEKIWGTGLTKHNDWRINKISEGLLGWYADGGVPWNKGKTGLIKISENSKRQAALAKIGLSNFHCIGDYQRGRTFDAVHRKKLSDKAMKREKKKCTHCGVLAGNAMFKRWHGDNCRKLDGDY